MVLRIQNSPLQPLKKKMKTATTTKKNINYLAIAIRLSNSLQSVMSSSILGSVSSLCLTSLLFSERHFHFKFLLDTTVLL